MFKHYFELIDGIDIYPLLSLLLFFIFFAAILIWSIRANPNYIKNMEEIPFDKMNNDIVEK